MQVVKDRLLLEGQRVHVYYNLHKGGYSIRDKKTMWVVAYAQNVLIKNCVFKVSEKGRQKVIAEKRKRVHAFIEGDFVWADQDLDTKYLDKIYYNPYKTERFMNTVNGSYVLKAPMTYCTDKICFV